MAEFGRFGILAEGRPIRLGGRAFGPAKVHDFLRQYGLQLAVMIRPSDLPAIIEFGHFRILPHRRQLLAEGRPIRLGGRAFDLLLALMEASGRWSARTSSRAASGKAAASSIRTGKRAQYCRAAQRL